MNKKFTSYNLHHTNIAYFHLFFSCPQRQCDSFHCVGKKSLHSFQLRSVTRMTIVSFVISSELLMLLLNFEFNTSITVNLNLTLFTLVILKNIGLSPLESND